MTDRQRRVRGSSTGSAAREAASLDDYRWLLSPDGESWLAIARERVADLSQTSSGPPPAEYLTRLLLRLRKDLSEERARLVVQQTALRQRAREKFSLAQRMFFTRKGLEQATDEIIGSYKATRFSASSTMVDLCCGIGGDLVALARRGRAHGLDLDPVAVLLAQANARVCGMTEEQCTVSQQDVLGFPFDRQCHWHCDPDRRPQGQRTTQVEFGEPSLETIERLLEQNSNAALKLAPAAVVLPSWLERAELEWIGSRGECRQQVAWFGELARNPGMRGATIVAPLKMPRTVSGTGNEPMPVKSQLARYIYEPDAAILAAGLIGRLCQEHVLTTIAPGIAYLTGEHLVRDAALDGFEIFDILPLDRKQLKAYCRERRIGRLSIKKRGVDIDPEHLRKEIIGAGDEEATLIILPLANKVCALVVRRIADGSAL